MDVADKRHWVLTEVSLVIKGRDLQPEEITPFLDAEPTGVRNPGPSERDRPGEILSVAARKRVELRQLAARGMR